MSSLRRATDWKPAPFKGFMNLVVLLLILLMFGALPVYPYSATWGYYPAGGTGLVVIILLVLLLTGRL